MSPFFSGRRRAAAAAAAGSAVLTLIAGCSSTGSGSAARPSGSPSASSTPSAATGTPHPGKGESAPDAAAYRRWGLERPPAAPPAPPAKKITDGMRDGDAPKIVRRIPTQDKVVFLTFDDGAEKDPQFVRMAKDLKLPFTMFLTDSVAHTGQGYGYFEQLRDAPGGGVRNGVDNHTIDHPNLRTLSAEAQKKEICTQQETLQKRFGERPALFRPPYGNYNDATLAAARACGVRAVVLWEATMQINDMRYAEGDGLRPGDIVLAHFRGPQELKGTTMTQMVTNMLRSIERQGYTVGRLEDYL
ncbi:polysaccharide deacetylase family protein [Streptomyces sp. NPDC049585]|uniref:polysaccharide deacetylase family protein n=1 Tax=Streptomyces sp. NPDC049585 TaxID=3155154 RepID=UPI00341A0005